MLDLRFVRENPDLVKQNIKNKFQDEKLPLKEEPHNRKRTSSVRRETDCQNRLVL